MRLSRMLVVVPVALVCLGIQVPSAFAIWNGLPQNPQPAWAARIVAGNDVCTGTLISPQFVITAAHCFDGAVGVVATIAGNRDPGTVYRFPNWSLGYPDIALIRLDSPAQGASWLPLATAADMSYFSGKTISVFGYGPRTQTGVATQIIDKSPQGAWMLAGSCPNVITDARRCFKFVGSYPNGIITAGDSGGPWVGWRNGGWHILAVVSGPFFGGAIKCCNWQGATSPATPEVADWISGTMAVLSPPVAGLPEVTATSNGDRLDVQLLNFPTGATPYFCHRGGGYPTGGTIVSSGQITVSASSQTFAGLCSGSGNFWVGLQATDGYAYYSNQVNLVPPSGPQAGNETAGPAGSGTFANYSNAGGATGQRIAPYQTVQVSCKLHGFAVADGNNWWYLIASSPWDGEFYAPADNFYNNGQTSGSLRGTPFVDPSVPDCSATPSPPPPPPTTRGFHIEDDFLGGTWGRSDPSNGTWYAHSVRPPNGVVWYPNNLAVNVDCAVTGASYVVHYFGGATQTWNTWFHVTDGNWYPSAATREVYNNSFYGLPTCSTTAPPPSPTVSNFSDCPSSDASSIGSDPTSGTTVLSCNHDYGNSVPATSGVVCSAVIQNGTGQSFSLSMSDPNSLQVVTPVEQIGGATWYVSVEETYSGDAPTGTFHCDINVGGETLTSRAFEVGSSAPTTYPETTGGVTNTWSDYTDAGGTQGPTIGSNATVNVICRITGWTAPDGNNWWYRIGSSPWNGQYFASADAFYNNGATSGPLTGTPSYDPAVPICQVSTQA